ncbi:uncharacterized protein IL334_002596 [Kwoniella shivajii]|uniref:Protein CPL1-like domain-containing protein n=1 Tax=Kwoniella shivajii TaxID=564305 RepID=A0ABZ1CV57_9TREE|nr:hypothetical protein IL334_002596 [Kwoniella shivajii]
MPRLATIPLSIIALASLVSSVNGYAFVGCVDASSLSQFSFGEVATDGSDVGTTQDSCLAYCQAQSYTTGAYRNPDDPQDPGYCYCTSTDPPVSVYDLERGADSAGNCVTGNTQLFDVQTDFAFTGCYSYRPASSVFIDYNLGIEGCINACSSYVFALPQIYSAGSGRGQACYCASDSATTDMTCDVNTYYAYDHNVPIVPSNQINRRAFNMKKLAARRLSREQPYCPQDTTACRVPTSNGDSYECLDINSELESCGGCMSGIYGSSNTTASGTDCSTLSGAAFGAATCFKGSCQIWACEEGFVLEANQCVKA